MYKKYMFKAKQHLDSNLSNYNNWVYGYLFTITGKAFYVIDNGKQIRIDPDTICRPTELRDKNGTLIYENDKVIADGFSPSEYTISFIEGGFCLTHLDIEGYPIDINMMYPSIGCQIEVTGSGK
jgi:hypothetical protein